MKNTEQIARLGRKMMEDNEVRIELEDQDLLFLFMEAHKKDITFNQYVNQVLRDWMIKVETDPLEKEELKKLVLREQLKKQQ